MKRPLTSPERLLIAALFGAAFVYCLYGAVSGGLYLPGRHEPGAMLSGAAAWIFCVAPALFYAAILVRHGYLRVRTTRRALTEGVLFVAGFAAIVLALHLR
jgi:hypothetical protein